MVDRAERKSDDMTDVDSHDVDSHDVDSHDVDAGAALPPASSASDMGTDGEDPFSSGTVRRVAEDQAEGLIVDVRGFEGPLDLLLTLARAQKVDLTQISILALVEQYLIFITELRRMRLELAADYLVMAAWLAYLKSKLLLPEQEEEEEGPSGEELAAALAFRLRRLEAMRNAATQLITRNRLGRDVFCRGAPEGVRVVRHTSYQAKIYDLLRAYGKMRENNTELQYRVETRQVVSLQQARDILQRLLGHMSDWAPLHELLVAERKSTRASAETALASSFSASLEMAREGVIELRQNRAFAPLYMRATGTRSS